MKKITSKYATKKVNSKYYLQLIVSNEGKSPKKLTREEFEAGEAGEAGLVYFDNESGKLVFDDQILHVREKARTHIRRIMERLKRY